MKTLKTLGAIGASALALSAVSTIPAAAQPWRAPAMTYEHPITASYVQNLDWRITQAARQGAISWGQARALRAQLREVQPIAWRVQRGQATDWEYRRLMRVVNRVERVTQSYAMNAAPPYAWGYRR